MKKWILLFLFIPSICFGGIPSPAPQPLGSGSFSEDGDYTPTGTWDWSGVNGATTWPTFDQNTTGTAAALTANGANCAAGSAPLGVDAEGAVESCFDVWTEAENTAAGYAAANDSPLTGDPTVTDATPTITLQDSDDAAGTAGIYGESSGGANDVVLTIGVEDSTGAKTGYLEIDGVNERINFLKPAGIGPITIDMTEDLADGGYRGHVLLGTAGANLTAGQWVYKASADSKMELCDRDSTTAEVNECDGLVVADASEDASVTYMTYGLIRLDTAFDWSGTPGLPIYSSNTAGGSTESRAISASEMPQQLGYNVDSVDYMFVDVRPPDFSLTRIATDADGETLTCLEVQNTIWEVTAAATIVGPALSTCPVQNFTICASVAGAVVYDPNAADDTIVDGTAKGDGVAWTSLSALGDCITITQYDADTLFGLSNGWTAP